MGGRPLIMGSEGSRIAARTAGRCVHLPDAGVGAAAIAVDDSTDRNRLIDLTDRRLSIVTTCVRGETATRIVSTIDN